MKQTAFEMSKGVNVQRCKRAINVLRAFLKSAFKPIIVKYNK